jgi:hypothetical protein
MNYLELTPARANGGADRPVLVPVLPTLPETSASGVFQMRATRRRLNATRLRTTDFGLRPFRIS